MGELPEVIGVQKQTLADGLLRPGIELVALARLDGHRISAHAGGVREKQFSLNGVSKVLAYVRRPRKLGSSMQSATCCLARRSAEIWFQYPQKSPQWPGHIPHLIAQVLDFDEVKEISLV